MYICVVRIQYTIIVVLIQQCKEVNLSIFVFKSVPSMIPAVFLWTVLESLISWKMVQRSESIHLCFTKVCSQWYLLDLVVGPMGAPHCDSGSQRCRKQHACSPCPTPCPPPHICAPHALPGDHYSATQACRMPLEFVKFTVLNHSAIGQSIYIVYIVQLKNQTQFVCFWKHFWII